MPRRKRSDTEATSTVLPPRPRCQTCNETVTRWIKSKNTWWAWCSNKCMSVDPVVAEKKRQTNLQKFGGHPMHSPEHRQKQKDTILEHYGVDNPSKSSVVKEKMRDTFRKNYGTDNPSKNKAVIEKIRNKANTKFASPAERDSILSKRRETNLERFGSINNSCSHISSEILVLIKDLDWLTHQHFVLKKSIQQIADELGVSPTPILKFLASNDVELIRYNNIDELSSIHADILSFLNLLYSGEILINNRTLARPKEIDLYLPDAKLAIEVDGVYWHTERAGKTKDYHLSKTTVCEENNVQLLHIYDIEWLNQIKQEIVKSEITRRLGQSVVLNANSSEVKIEELTESACLEFFNQNHIHGSCQLTNDSLSLGLFFDDVLVSAAIIEKSGSLFELLRYCDLCNFLVTDGLNRLLTFAAETHNINQLITYVDRRWVSNIDTNNVNSTSPVNPYMCAGFVATKILEPEYKYVKGDVILDQATELSDCLLKFDENLNECDNMQSNGFYRLWDCGKIKYEWEYNENTRHNRTTR